MPSAWLILLRTNTFPPLPLLTLSLPCKSASLRPHFHLNFKKNPFPPQTAGPASVSRPWSLSGLLLFRQLTNDLDSLVNSGAHTHTHARNRCTTASVVRSWPPSQTKGLRWPLCCLGWGQIAGMSVWTPDLWPCGGSLTTSNVHSIGYVTTEHNNTANKIATAPTVGLCFRRHLHHQATDLASRSAERRHHWNWEAALTSVSCLQHCLHKDASEVPSEFLPFCSGWKIHKESWERKKNPSLASPHKYLSIR